MTSQISEVLNLLYQKQVTSREQLLIEALRVNITKEAISGNATIYKLFSVMKENTEDELGFFPADRNDFAEIYEVLKDIDLCEFLSEVYKDDRSGIIITPLPLIQYIKNRIKLLTPKAVLITEAEKHLSGLIFLVDSCGGDVTLTTQNKTFHTLLSVLFKGKKNVEVKMVSIYSLLLDEKKFDYIFCLPAFGGKVLELNEGFITKEYDGIALENMLRHLQTNGTMDYIAPAKITFAAGGYEKLRNDVIQNQAIESLYMLPEGTFRPYTAIKTYLFSISKKVVDVVKIGELVQKKNNLSPKNETEMPMDEFCSHDDWRFELLLSGDDENIKRFKASNTPKIKLKEVAEVFRGKSILKKDTTPGEIAVLNISNIENGEIVYEEMETIGDEERKVKRYELLTGDVVLSCRGTAIKTAVFRSWEKMTIASANVVVIRPNKKVLPGFIKMFFESPTGLVMIKSFQRGTTIMNINHTDIMEMEIPLLPMGRQEAITMEYNGEFESYKKQITEAEQRLKKTKDKLFGEMI